METIAVNIPGASYSIHVSRDETGWLEPLKNLVQDQPLLVMTSRRVVRHAWSRFKKSMIPLHLKRTTFLLEDGETNKNLKSVAKGYRALLRLKADRKTCLVILGGGVLGDLGGFLAATYLRGIPFVQVPTTLVAQVDSSIGGKVGVDLPEGKNLVGAFAQPRAVLSHVPFLRTLPRRELVGGLAEVIKYGVIEDPSLVGFVRDHREKILKADEEALFPIVTKSSVIKARVVSADEKESGLRMILNFGHTFGHAVERLTRYRKYHHGEAVAIGMVIAARISQKLGVCQAAEAKILEETLRSVGLPVLAPKFPVSSWKSAIEVDKKSRGGMIHFVAMKKLGEVEVIPLAPKDLVKLL